MVCAFSHKLTETFRRLSNRATICNLKGTDRCFLDDVDKAVRQHRFDAFLQLICPKVATIMTTGNR